MQIKPAGALWGKVEFLYKHLLSRINVNFGLVNQQILFISVLKSIYGHYYLEQFYFFVKFLYVLYSNASDQTKEHAIKSVKLMKQ